MKSTHFGVHFKSGHPFDSFPARRPDTRIRYVDAKRVNVTQFSQVEENNYDGNNNDNYDNKDNFLFHAACRFLFFMRQPKLS